jgi:YVTN family beta-propeller protein
MHQPPTGIRTPAVISNGFNQHTLGWMARTALLLTLMITAVHAANVLLVVGSPTLSAGDTVLRNRLQTLGHTVTIVDDNVATAGSAAGMALIVISESVETATGVGAVFANVTVPLIASDSGLFAPLKMTGATLNTDYGTVAAQTQVTITDPTHPLAAGLSGTVTVVTSVDTFDFGVPSAAAKKIATPVGQAGKASVFAYDTGAAMVGMNAPARRVAWFAEDTVVTKLTANGFALFDAAVAWALGSGTGGTSGPGLPKITFNASQVFTGELSRIIPPAGMSHGRACMVDGYFFLPYFKDQAPGGGGIDVYNLSNPSSPVRLLRKQDSSTASIREPHGFGFSYHNGQRLWICQAINGIDIWDLTNVLNPVRIKNLALSGITNGVDYAGVWWCSLQAPYVYVSGNNSGLYIINMSDPANPTVVKNIPISQLGGFSIGANQVIGNMLILASNAQSSISASQFGGRYTFMDIADPANPVMIKTYGASGNFPNGYASLANGNKLLIGGVSDNFQMLNIADPANVTLTTLLSVPGAPGGYVNVQDNFAFSGFQTRVVKVDVSGANPTLNASGSSGNPDKDDNFAIPLGNMLFASNDHPTYSSIMVQGTAPDNTAPAVNMVNPKNGATNQALTTRIGLTFTDELIDTTLTTASIIVRPVGGSAIPGRYSYQNAIVNFWPTSPLLPNTTYEVVVPVGGVRDVSTNAVTTAFLSTFSTGASIGNPVAVAMTKPVNRTVGAAASFSIASSSGTAPLQYSWDFGDGSPATSFSTTSAASHTYANARHYSVTVTVKDAANLTATATATQLIYNPLTASAPRASSTIVYASNNRVYSVNPDDDTVTVVDAATANKIAEIPVGRNPRTLTVGPGTSVWVANQDSATISVIDTASNSVTSTISMPYASQPFGIALAPNGGAVYVTLHATGQLAKIDPTTRVIVGTPTGVGPDPRGVAISGDSQRILVTRFVSSDTGGEIREVSAASMAVARTFVLPLDTTSQDTEKSGRGLPNYLTSVAISPDGSTAWIPSKKDNIVRGTRRDGLALTFENSVRTIVSQINLSNNSLGNVLDFNDRDLANAVAFSPLGDYAFIATQGTNTIEVLDAFDPQNRTALVINTGLAPQGLVVSPDGSRLFVQNFMDRSVGVYDISGVTGFTTNIATPVATVNAVAVSKLTPTVLTGKRIFYNANSRQMNRDGYISCASCHIDGGSDGRVWDFSDRGEGFRRTTNLQGRSGVAHGAVHWSGNFDEIHDFEHDMRNGFKGSGFMADALFNTGTRNTTLGDPKAGVTPELDALAAYVSSLSAAKPSPYRNQDGSLTAAAIAGKQVFTALNCASCHAGPRLTDSTLNLFHNVGTQKTTSGQRLGQTLTGIDTPTLKGAWSNRVFLHDGSAATFLDVLTTANPANQHGVTSTLSAADRTNLVEYLKQIDDAETPAYQQPSSGDSLVVIEAESFIAKQAPGAQSWIPTMTPSGFAGGIAIQALPNSGSPSIDASINASSPRVDYLVNFTRTGTHYVWIRGMGATTADNSLHVGIDGVPASTAAAVSLPGTLGWGNVPTAGGIATITVGSVGLHTINLWMREDGVVVDRVLLTTNATFVPTATGPAESATGASSPVVVAPTITTQPLAQTATVGQSATFSVAASGTGPLTYVWKRGTTIVGGNSATLSMSNIQTTDAGSYTCTVSNSAGTAISSAATLTVNTAIPDSFQQDNGVDGLVVIEGENAFGNRIAAGGKTWQTVTTPTGFSGSGAIQALSNTGVMVDLANLASSPRVDYRITFTKTGTHYLWIRGLGATGADNSVTVGIDGVATTTSENLSLPTSYGWNNTNLTPPGGTVRTINVASVGLHTLNLWMREDGVVVDKLLLTVNAGHIPSGSGPAESPLVGVTPPPPVLPVPWVTSVIGNASPAGSASAVNDVFTISGSGADIWGTADAFRAVTQPITGNCDLIARVDSLQNTNPWAKAGVMLRSSLQDNATHAMTVMTPGNGASFQNRVTNGAASNYVSGRLVSAPQWVKITRRGNVFSGYESDNGTTWNFIGSQTISMPAGIHACLVVTSHQPGVLCTAVISQLSVVPVASN